MTKVSLEWYETPDWSERAQTEFRERLTRSRSQRGHYLRVKASTLLAEADPSVRAAGLELAREFLSSSEESGRVVLLIQVGRAYEVDGKLSLAAKSFDDAVQQENEFPTEIAYATLYRAEFLQRTGLALDRQDIRDELWEWRTKNIDSEVPNYALQFRYFAVMARLSRDFGDEETAAVAARAALQFASIREPIPQQWEPVVSAELLEELSSISQLHDGDG